MRVRSFLLPLCLAAVCNVSCTSESSFEPQVTQMLELDQTVGESYRGLLLQFNRIKVGPDGFIYLSTNWMILRYTSNGERIGKVFNQVGGVKAFDLDSEGNLYVLGRWFHGVEVFRSDGELLRSWPLPPRDFVDNIVVTQGGEVLLLSREPMRQVFVYSTGGTHLNTWAPPSSPFGSRYPDGISVSSRGNPVLFYFSHAREFSLEGGLLSDNFVRAYDAVADNVGGMYYTSREGVVHYNATPSRDREWSKDEDGNNYMRSHSRPTIDLDSGGNPYVLDSSLGRVFKFSPSGNLLESWVDVPEPDGAIVDIGQTLAFPDGVHVLDLRLSRILTYSPEGDFQSAWGEPGLQNGMWGLAMDIAHGPDGSVYVLEESRIQRFSETGEFENAWRTDGHFAQLTVDNMGSLFVTSHDRVSKYSPQGVLLDTFGDFHFPSGIAIDDQGRLFVAFPLEGQVRVLTADGEEIDRWDLHGQQTGLFRLHLALDSKGFVYVTDPDRGVIEIYTTSGAHVTTFRGSSDHHTSPYSVTFDAIDRMVISDSYDDQVEIYRKIPGAGLE